jgi:hypothetical protein
MQRFTPALLIGAAVAFGGEAAMLYAEHNLKIPSVSAQGSRMDSWSPHGYERFHSSIPARDVKTVSGYTASISHGSLHPYGSIT